MTRVAVLTPAGAGAIATVAVVGPDAWRIMQSHFRPANGKPLPDQPAANRFWFGSLGDGPGDEVVVAVTALEPGPWVEVHCHGGRRVVRWVVEQFVGAGCAEVEWNRLPKTARHHDWACDDRALEPLTNAPTLRTAAILLDQYHGTFNTSVAGIVAALDSGNHVGAVALLNTLADLAPVGRHLVTPWRIAIAGPPNVGKSSLINALVGYHRTVVAPIAGTTRDVVTATAALDGWPVELADTAGLWEAPDSLEAEGIARARQLLSEADLVVWVIDATDSEPLFPGHDIPRPPLIAVNKTDLPNKWKQPDDPAVLLVSAATGAGLSELISAIVRSLVPTPPPPGAAVPFTPVLADTIESAHRLLSTGQVTAARETLASCLSGG